jgi:hypothetical protein
MSVLKKVIIFIIISSILSLFTGVGRGVWTMTYLMVAFNYYALVQPAPSKPEITKGKFRFRLEYKINGETRVIEDIYIAKYKGIRMDEGNDKYRKWKGYIKNSGEKDVVLLKINKDKIYYKINFPDYYMGDGRKHIYDSFEPFYLVYKSGHHQNSV